MTIENELTPVTPATPTPETGVTPATPAETTPETTPAPEVKTVPLGALEAERKKRQELAEQVAYYRGLTEANKKPEETTTPATPQAPQPPVLDNFDSYEDFQEADRKFTVELAKFEAAEEFKRQAAAEAKKQTVATAQKTFQERLTAFAATNPDITTIVRDPTLPVSTPMADMIQQSELGPQLLKHFHENRAEAARIAQMDSVMAAREIGRIEAKLSIVPTPTPVQTISLAPEPVTTIPSGSSAEITPEEDLPMEAFFKARAPKIFNRR